MGRRWPIAPLKAWRGTLNGALVIVAAGALTGIPVGSAMAAPGTYNVRDFGATGNGSTFDDDAIDRAINAAASDGGGGTVVFPSGTYRSRTIHLKSDITLQLNSGSTILAPSSGMDPAEPNPEWDDYQDFGHSHFRNALLFGENIANLSITGTGTFDGDGLTTDNNVPNGQGDKILSLKRCTNLRIQDVTFRRGGHFAMLLNGCNGITMDNVKVLSPDDRDGINVINSWNVEIANSRIEASDDALGLKSDYALGQTFVSQNIRVHDSTIRSTENNALQFGSETCGNFRNIRFERLNLTGSGKAGIGIVSMDGSIIEDVHYQDITLSRTSSPIFIKIGERRRCPGRPPAGRIRNITITNVTGTNLITPRDVAGDDEYSSTITGTPAVPVENVTLTNVRLSVPGGHPASEATRVPGEFLTTYPPRDYGKRPSYGFWLRHVRGITLNDTRVEFDNNDGRPAFFADDGANIVLNRFTAERGSSSAYDVGVSRIAGYAVRDGANTGGGALRIRATDSTPLPTEPPPGNRHEAENATITQGAVESQHAGFSGSGYVNTDNVTGCSVQWTVNAAAAGMARLTFGFTNGTTTNRPMDIRVNGALIDDLPFPGTGAWTAYQRASITVPVVAGANTILATAITANGGPNLDYVDVEPAPEPRTQAAVPAWQLRWAADPAVDGLRAFEYVEDDRANSHPAGQPHITVQGGDYRFVMHMQDRDTMTDRQRQEVRGMRSGGYDLVLLKGETWRITYSMFIPSSLKATTRFTHIMQTKAPGTGTNPMVTISLQRRNNVPKIELHATTSGVTVGSVDLTPLQNRWIDVELEMTIGDAPNGRLRWVIRNGASTVIDVTRGGIDNWLTDRVRPKWGIYRSLGDTSGSLQDCHLLIRNLRAYQWSDAPTMPAPVQHEAEDATINRGIREQSYTGWRGAGYVNTDNVPGSYVEWTVNAPYAATASLTIGYANGTTTDRPMDVTVNGALVANDLSFLHTLAWDQWETRTIVTPLRAGANTVRLTSVTANGGPNLDYLDLRMPPPPGSPGSDYQAESARISQAVVESTHAGYTGTGFVNFDNVAGSYAEFDVTAAVAGPATVTVRYANGTTVNRPMAVAVNGMPIHDDLAFPGTGAWSTWGTASVTVPLNAGVNPIRLTSTVASGGPNLDKITVG